MKKIFSIIIAFVIMISSLGCDNNQSSSNSNNNRIEEVEVGIINHTIQFQTNGGTRVPTQSGKKVISSPYTERDGYIFEGWYRDASLTHPVIFPLDIDDNMIIYAKWSKIHTVKFEVNGGTRVFDQSVKNVNSAPYTERDGYLFEGWYRDATLTQPVIFPLDVTDDMIIYAKWLKLKKEYSLQNFSIKLNSDFDNSALFRIDTDEFDLNRLSQLGYDLTLTLCYNVYYQKDYDVLWDIGYLGAPEYEIYFIDENDIGKFYENIKAPKNATTEQYSVTLSASRLQNENFYLKISTDNIQNRIYFYNITLTYQWH